MCDFEIQHTAHTMGGNDSDLEAFESNLRRILHRQARELGETAALVPNLCQNAPDPQLVNMSSKDNAQSRREPHGCTSSQSQSDLDDIQDNHKTSSENASLTGISTLLLAAGQQGKLMKTQFWQRWRRSIYQLFLFLSIAWKVLQLCGRARQGLLKLPIRVYGEPTTVKKMDKSSCVGMGKYQGGIPLPQLGMTRQRKLIPGIQTGFCWAMEYSAAFE